MKLLLFDIDGTLLDGFGAGREAVEAAFHDVTGRAIDSDGLPFSGKTDPQIVRELLEHNNAAGPGDNVDALAARVLRRYAERLAETLSQKCVEALPGIKALLAQLASRDDVLLALLTGNLERTAFLKLDAAGLAGFFAFGAFSSDDPDRNCLVPIAARRAEARTEHAVSGSDIVVIGDTPRDIACGQAHGTRTVAVCTGRYAPDDLEGADLVLGDLTDADRFVAEVVENPRR